MKDRLYALTISLSSDDDKMSKAVGVELLKDSSPVMLSSSTTSWILSQTENKTQLTLIIVCVQMDFTNSLIDKYEDALCVLKRVTLIIVCVLIDFTNILINKCRGALCLLKMVIILILIIIFLIVMYMCH